MSISFLAALSHVLGWLYTIAWSLSFYPQPLLNIARRSTSGTTADFPAINAFGFVAYLVSSVVFRYSPTIRRQYAARHHGLTPTVQINDVAFAAHAATLCLIIVTQYLTPGLWGWEKPRRTERISRPILGISISCVAGVLAVVLLAATSPTQDATSGWAWIDVVSCA